MLYPSQAAYNLAVANGQVPMIETNNILTHPTGPEYQLLVGEGRPAPCDSPSSSLRSSDNQSQPPCDNTSTGHCWNQDIITVLNFTPNRAPLIQSRYKPKRKIRATT
ncbi:hypothetical protein DH86_00002555 [Scytalidium sp. 3C]|nr:hypothetical protein DH86_00002555 [Scytalidium sp. 3C]